MATLLTVDRERIWRGLMRYLSRLRQTLALSKAELLAAVGATDGWIDSNQAGYNAALPEAARTNLTAEQKTLLFCAVALMRVSGAMLRRVLGEVD